MRTQQGAGRGLQRVLVQEALQLAALLQAGADLGHRLLRAQPRAVVPAGADPFELVAARTHAAAGGLTAHRSLMAAVSKLFSLAMKSTILAILSAASSRKCCVNSSSSRARAPKPHAGAHRVVGLIAKVVWLPSAWKVTCGTSRARGHGLCAAARLRCSRQPTVTLNLPGCPPCAGTVPLSWRGCCPCALCTEPARKNQAEGSHEGAPGGQPSRQAVWAERSRQNARLGLCLRTALVCLERAVLP